MVGGGTFRDLSKVSPDGKFTAYVIDKDGNKYVFIKDNSSDKPIEIFNGIKDIYCLRWSPDGNNILLSGMLFNQKLVDFIIPKFGGKARLVDLPLHTVTWSPNGSLFAGIEIPKDFITIVNTETRNSIDTIKLKGDYDLFQEVDWAPNRNGLVCLTYSYKIKSYILWTIKIDGTQQKQVVQTNKKLFSPRWSFNGRYIYYLQESNGTRNLMKVEVSSEGTAESEPKIVVTGLDAYGFSFTADNKKIVYTKNLSYSNLWELKFKNERNLSNLQSYQTAQ